MPSTTIGRSLQKKPVGSTLFVCLAAVFILGSLACQAGNPASDNRAVTPPAPVLPLPGAAHLQYYDEEMRLFVHFTVNTFTDLEWGDGTEKPSIFDPAALDTDQWAKVAKDNGFGTIILTAKHHDGFALWDSAYTDHDVAASPWRGGKGDLVAELAASTARFGLGLGLYLSPWDRHEPVYGDAQAYNAFYMGQLRELLSNYGPLRELWFDGAKGKDSRDMVYHFDKYWAMVEQLQPGALAFSDRGPGVRWIGNEKGFAESTNWSTFDRSQVKVGESPVKPIMREGLYNGPDWVSAECDVSIRPGWFYHAHETPKTTDELMEIYYRSVGRNCMLLLNVPPGPDGLIAPEDIAALAAFTSRRKQIFANDLLADATIEASHLRGNDPTYGTETLRDKNRETYWAPDDGVDRSQLIITLPNSRQFNVIRLEEPVQLGQRIARYAIDAEQAGQWREIVRGTTVGTRKLDRLKRPVTAKRLRIRLLESRDIALLSGIGLYFDAAFNNWQLDAAVARSEGNK